MAWRTDMKAPAGLPRPRQPTRKQWRCGPTIGTAQTLPAVLPPSTEPRRTLQKGGALPPHQWDRYNTLGLFYHRQRRPDDAIAQLRHAVELTPDNPAAYNNLATVYFDTGRPQDLVLAEKALRKSIELGPTYNAFTNLGYLYLKQERYAESAEMTRK